MSKKNRIATYIKTAIEEMELAEQMSEPINEADDFGKNLNGMTIFRACSMSIQCVTENFIKVRNNTKSGFFKKYNSIPCPQLKEVSKHILDDLQNGLLDDFMED